MVKALLAVCIMKNIVFLFIQTLNYWRGNFKNKGVFSGFFFPEKYFAKETISLIYVL